MLLDHMGVVLGYTSKMSALSYMTMRSLGRAAFPLYLFLLINGFEHTHDRRRYLGRLCLFAALSQLPFSVSLTAENYQSLSPAFELAYDADPVFYLAAAAVGLYCILGRKKGETIPTEFFAAFLLSRLYLKFGGLVILGKRLNILYTLVCCVLLMDVCERLRHDERDAVSLSAILAALCVCADALRYSDYGFSSLPLLVPLYLTRSDKRWQAAVVALWCLYKYPPWENGLLFLGALLSLLPILFFTGAEGRKSRLFYLIYPVHLSVLALVPILLPSNLLN